MARAETPHKALHLTGAATLVSRDKKLLQRPRQVSLVVKKIYRALARSPLFIENWTGKSWTVQVVSGSD